MMTIQTSAPAAATNANPAPAANGPDAALLALTPDDAAAPGQDGADAALPALFATLLNQAGQQLPADPALDDALAATDSGSADAGLPADGGDSTVAAAPADTGALPAMVTSMLVIAMPPLSAALAAPAPAAGSAGSTNDNSSARVDALGAATAGTAGGGAILNASSTRLNLAAAGVAVMAAASAPAAAPAAAAAPATGGYDAAASSAADAAAAGNELTPAPSPTPAASLAAAGSAQAASAAGAIAANAAAASAAAVASASATQGGARSAARSDDSTTGGKSGSSQSGSSNAASAVPLGASKDDGIAAAPRVTAAPAPSGVTGSYAQAAQQAQNNGAAVKLAGTPEQWQQPLREALGDRLQLQLQRNDNQAVIRLDPPNMGRIEISIRHSAGALQVNLSANNSEVLRQLNSIGDSVRQDLSQRQFNDVAVTVSAARAGQGQADADGRGRQQRDADEGRTPSRALSDDSAAAGSFAMLTERE